MTTPQHIPPHKRDRTTQEILKVAKIAATHGCAAASERFGISPKNVANIVKKANRLQKAAAQ